MTAKPTRVPFLPPHLHIILFFFSFLSCCPDHVTLHFLYTQTRRTCVRTVDGNRPHTGQSLQSTSVLRLRLNNEDKINLSKSQATHCQSGCIFGTRLCCRLKVNLLKNSNVMKRSRIGHINRGVERSVIVQSQMCCICLEMIK